METILSDPSNFVYVVGRTFSEAKLQLHDAKCDELDCNRIAAIMLHNLVQCVPLVCTHGGSDCEKAFHAVYESFKYVDAESGYCFTYYQPVRSIEHNVTILSS